MKKSKDNYLDKIPILNEKISWNADENGLLTLKIENKGVFNRIAQKFFKKPKFSYVHLDENGSFIWQLIDSKRTVFDIAALVDAHFGEKAHPLYERLIKYLEILASYNFIELK